MVDTPSPVSLVNPIQFHRGAEFKDIYSNFIRLGVSGSDINIVFSRVVEPAPGINIVEDQAIVRMSPHQFKIFIAQATQTLKGWEEIFGEIRQSLKIPSQDVITDGIKRLKEALDKAQP